MEGTSTRESLRVREPVLILRGGLVQAPQMDDPVVPAPDLYALSEQPLKILWIGRVNAVGVPISYVIGSARSNKHATRALCPQFFRQMLSYSMLVRENQPLSRLIRVRPERHRGHRPPVFTV